MHIINDSYLPVTLNLDKTIIDSLLSQLNQKNMLGKWIDEHIKEVDPAGFKTVSANSSTDKDHAQRTYDDILPLLTHYIFHTFLDFYRDCCESKHGYGSFDLVYVKDINENEEKICMANYGTIQSDTPVLPKGELCQIVIDKGEKVILKCFNYGLMRSIGYAEFSAEHKIRDEPNYFFNLSAHNLYYLTQVRFSAQNSKGYIQTVILADDLQLSISNLPATTSILVITKNKCTLSCVNRSQRESSDNKTNDSSHLVTVQNPKLCTKNIQVCSPEIAGSQYLTPKSILPASWAKSLHAYAVNEFEQAGGVFGFFGKKKDSLFW